MSHLLDEIVRAQKRGEARGNPSIMPAHSWVLRAALRGESPILIESTCNQVNQLGGYTGMTPADFVCLVRDLAAKNGFPVENLILGGDHLGPSPWQHLRAEQAVTLAREMVRAYVQAGYTKLHLDASMSLGDDDPQRPLDPEIVAQRTADLARAAEKAAEEAGRPVQELRYVIGTDVPPPGGATDSKCDAHITPVEDVRRTIEVIHAAFLAIGLEAAWERVIAVVVQPGIEFGDDFVLDYNVEVARDLAHLCETMPFVYEAHSTDYQRPQNLRALVRDHFAILKVGPALTFTFRQAVFALAMIEQELFPPEERSRLIETLESAMLRDSSHWQKYYQGDPHELALARKYSMSDRIRYYWQRPEVRAALKKLLDNLNRKGLPLTLVHQFLPDLWPKIRAGQIPCSADTIILERIGQVLEDYAWACGLDSSPAQRW